MLWHVIGWVTLALTFVTGAGVLQWLRVACRDAISWHRPLPVPKAAADFTFSGGSDYVGYC